MRSHMRRNSEGTAVINSC